MYPLSLPTRRLFVRAGAIVGAMLSLGVSSSSAAEYYVSANAVAPFEGTLTRPDPTITAGLARAQAGDTVFIRGGTYYGGAAFPRSGTTGKAITLEAYSPDGSAARRETVTINRASLLIPGQDGVGQWQNLGNGHWSIQLPSGAYSADIGRTQVILGGTQLQAGRWPNSIRLVDPDKSRAAESTSGTVVARDVDGTLDEGRYTLPGLDQFPAGSLVGAGRVSVPSKGATAFAET